MAVDVRDMASARDNRLQGRQDTEITRTLMIIVGGSLAFLVAVKLGFLGRVLP